MAIEIIHPKLTRDYKIFHAVLIYVGRENGLTYPGKCAEVVWDLQVRKCQIGLPGS